MLLLPKVRTLLAAVALAATAGVAQVRALPQTQELAIEQTYVNARIEGKIYRLEALIVRPEKMQGRLPIALIAHGKPSGEAQMADRGAAIYTPVARDFARRGYLTITVMRRGFGKSDGPSPALSGCAAPSLIPAFDAAADDIAAAIAEIAKRPDADASRIVAIGVSAGGGAVTAWAARNPPGLKAVVNISGGLHFTGCNKQPQLVEAFASYGKRSKVSSLWLYSENDSLFPPALVNRMQEAYLASGGDVKLLRLGKLKTDGHRLFSTLEGRRLWLGHVDAFLRAGKLPTWDAAYVKTLLQQANLEAKFRTRVENYLGFPGEKALAYSPSAKRGAGNFGAANLQQARSRALQACRDGSKRGDCRIVLENLLAANSTKNAEAMAARAASAAAILTRLGMSSRRQPYIERYLDAPGRKAMVRSDPAKGSRRFYTFIAGQDSVAAARSRALARCREKTKLPCSVIMEEDAALSPAAGVAPAKPGRSVGGAGKN
ncbi:MAG: dienelactone hydrolase family protein [Beijerinckiaceae bacterium]